MPKNKPEGPKWPPSGLNSIMTTCLLCSKHSCILHFGWPGAVNLMDSYGVKECVRTSEDQCELKIIISQCLSLFTLGKKQRSDRNHCLACCDYVLPRLRFHFYHIPTDKTLNSWNVSSRISYLNAWDGWGSGIPVLWWVERIQRNTQAERELFTLTNSSYHWASLLTSCHV